MNAKFRGDKFWLALLIAIIAARLAVFAGVWIDPQRALKPDSLDYLRLADGLAQGEGFVTSGNPESFRVPGYPVFLAVLQQLSDSLRFISFVQVMLSIATCVLTWDIARTLAGEKGGFIGLAVQGFSIVSAVFACRILSEALFVFIFVVFLRLFLLGYARPGLWGGRLRVLTAGALLAAAAYVRAVAVPLGFLCVGYWLCKRQFKSALLLAATWLVLLAPWYLRNWIKTGTPQFSTVAEINFYRYNTCMLLAHLNERSFAEQQSIIDSQLAELDTQVARARYAGRRARKEIGDHPWVYFGLHLGTVPGNMLPAAGDLFQIVGVPIGGGGTLGVIRNRGVVAGVRHYFRGKWIWFLAAVPVVLLMVAIYLLAAFGLICGLREPSCRPAVVFMVLLAAYFIIAPGAAANPRFRVPVMPLLAVVAAHSGCKKNYRKNSRGAQ